MFHVGQLVVCVDDSPTGRVWRDGYETFVRTGLQKGQVYTVRAVGDIDIVVPVPRKRLCLWLEELIATDGLVEDCGLRVSRFRPVTKRNEEIIASMLIPVKDAVNA